jgi:hypothetical protein
MPLFLTSALFIDILLSMLFRVNEAPKPCLMDSQS